MGSDRQVIDFQVDIGILFVYGTALTALRACLRRLRSSRLTLLAFRGYSPGVWKPMGEAREARDTSRMDQNRGRGREASAPQSDRRLQSDSRSSSGP